MGAFEETIRSGVPVSRWLVTGAGGMLGRELQATLSRMGEDVTGVARTDVDVTNPDAVDAAVRRYRPTIVVNCAAWTAVDDAEVREPEALSTNGYGAEYVAAACASIGARMVQISTDYVFSGDESQPYAEHAPTRPRTAYGRTKLAGEQAVLQLLPDTGCVIRTAWLYGAYGPNFVSTMMKLARGQSTVQVVADQHGQPTWAADVAAQIVALAHAGVCAGIYHATSSGKTTWFDLAREIFRLVGADPVRVHPTESNPCQRTARRPSYSVLGHDGWAEAGLEPIDEWSRALRRAIPFLVSTSARSS